MSKHKTVWILKYSHNSLFGLNAWKYNGRWPRPNGYIKRVSKYGCNIPKAFASKQAAEDFLYDQRVRKRRDVSRWTPRRYKNTWGFSYE